MKRKSAILLMAVLLLCMTGCSESKNDTDISETVSSVSKEVSNENSVSSASEEVSEISMAESSSQPEETSVSSAPEDISELSMAESSYQSEETPISSAPEDVSEISKTESSYDWEDDDDGCDALYTIGFEDKAFLFFKTNNHLYREESVFDLESHEEEYSAIMPIENGEFVSVRADGYTLSGGIMGYCGEPFFDKINSQEKLTAEQAVEQFNIPEARDVKRLFSLDTVMKHTIGDRMYIIFQTGSFDVYLDSNLVGTASHDKVWGEEGKTDPEKRIEKLIEFVEELDRSGQAG